MLTCIFLSTQFISSKVHVALSTSSETMMCHYLAQLYLSSAWSIAIVFFLDLVIIYLCSRYIVVINLISIFCVVSLNKKA